MPCLVRCHAQGYSIHKFVASRLALGPYQEVADRHADFLLDGHRGKVAEIRAGAKLNITK